MPDEDPRVSRADREVARAVATGEGLIQIRDLEHLHALAALAAERKAEFDAVAGRYVTPDRAWYVRSLRVDGGYTWRAVAETCALEWGGGWGDNQLAGMAICERAASLCGEDPYGDPWN